MNIEFEYQTDFVSWIIFNLNSDDSDQDQRESTQLRHQKIEQIMKYYHHVNSSFMVYIV